MYLEQSSTHRYPVGSLVMDFDDAYLVFEVGEVIAVAKDRESEVISIRFKDGSIRVRNASSSNLRGAQ